MQVHTHRYRYEIVGNGGEIEFGGASQTTLMSIPAVSIPPRAQRMPAGSKLMPIPAIPSGDAMLHGHVRHCCDHGSIRHRDTVNVQLSASAVLLSFEFCVPLRRMPTSFDKTRRGPIRIA